MFLLSFIFVKACGRLSRRESLHVFTLFVYICIAVGDSLFKRGRVMVPLIRLTPLHCFVLPTRTCISIGKWREWRKFFIFCELGWELIVRFVYIGGIVEHHCLNFHFVAKISSQMQNEEQQSKYCSGIVMCNWVFSLVILIFSLGPYIPEIEL
jgi:hypothetical protein